MLVYFAAPWFSPEQAAIHNRVYTTIKASRHRVFSPKHELEVGPDASHEVRKRAFTMNLMQLSLADFVVAVTDYKDVGTIWEAGYAYRSNKPIIYYAETLGDRPFNLMLAESGVAVVKDIEGLDHVLSSIKTPANLLRMKLVYRGRIE